MTVSGSKGGMSAMSEETTLIESAKGAPSVRPGGDGRHPPAIVESLRLPAKTQVKVALEVTTEVNVSQYMAKVLAQDFLLMKVGNLLRADEPVFVVSDPPCWNVPVILTNPQVGRVGQVGAVRVDADTGEILAGRRDIETLQGQANELARSASLETGNLLPLPGSPVPPGHYSTDARLTFPTRWRGYF